MSDMMRALVKSRPEPGLWMEEVPVPEPGPNDVLIRVAKSAICGTDVHIWNWDAWAAQTVPVPMVVGHEFVGRIVDAGAAVTRFKLGERVSGEGHIVCGFCRNCRAGRGHLCRNTVGVGVHRPGSFAEYLCLPERNVVPIPDDIPDEVAAIFDPLGNAVPGTRVPVAVPMAHQVHHGDDEFRVAHRVDPRLDRRHAVEECIDALVQERVRMDGLEPFEEEREVRPAAGGIRWRALRVAGSGSLNSDRWHRRAGRARLHFRRGPAAGDQERKQRDDGDVTASSTAHGFSNGDAEGYYELELSG